MKLSELIGIEKPCESQIDYEVRTVVRKIKDAYLDGQPKALLGYRELSDLGADEIRALGYQCFWSRDCQWWEVSGW